MTGTFSIIDARASGFSNGHIPQSQNMNWKDFTEEKPSFFNLLFGHPERWGRVASSCVVEAQLRQLGLSHDRLIVVVGSPDGWGEEGRVAWNLLYWGAQKVALLDGGFSTWKKSGYPVESGRAAKVIQGDFNLKLNHQCRAKMKDVENFLKSTAHQFFDVRTLKEFNGQKVPGQKRGGRISGAKLIEFKSLYQKDGTYISGFELTKLIGDGSTKIPVTYCTGGVRSALLAVLIEARLGIRAINYEASMWEWSQDPQNPMEK